MDKNFAARMALKQQVIDKVGPDALDCREGGLEGCIELLGILTEYLTRRFPSVFKLSEDGIYIRNAVTNETHRVVAPYDNHPLHVAGRLVEDDLNILTPGPDGEYVLSAVLSAFPAGFHVREKMGKPMTEIHKTVPTYKEKLQKAMNKYFDSVGPSKLVMRLNWSINDHEELFLVEGAHLYENDVPVVDTSIDIDQVQLRVERQVLRRLPKSGAMCMLTKTYLYRLVEIAEYPGFAARLAGLLHKLPTKFAFYKRKPVWGEIVLGYLDEMAKRHPAEFEVVQ
ncbi:hypothetical protein BU16DRAFT_259183 [Lophium mytilinum]|uniref:Uncharacterized protein n=1 Tax=Lophium mytilinum TaxID=390894 RepID=A0A6A6R898_9PEZI|nr:hypothetical protein BU16DRAFT_259183 [Lophium mytilinum]